MSTTCTPPLDMRTQRAVDELQELIQRHYPAAVFQVQRGQDDPEAIHLLAIVDIDDTDAIFDIVLNRMMEIQIEQEIPVFVIPLQPPDRVQAMLAADQLAGSVGLSSESS